MTYKLREEEGEFYKLVSQRLKVEKRFFLYFRIDTDNFDKILMTIRSKITNIYVEVKII